MSEPLTMITSPAAAMLENGIDTDVIFPARFLLRMEKEGLGECLFADREPLKRSLRCLDGQPVQILLAGAQFGCGSSREHAVWSLVDFGIRVIIAPSFGEIFASNAARNGLAAIQLPPEQVDLLAGKGAAGDFTVDLLSRIITAPSGRTFAFDLAEGDQLALINGWDEIDMIHAAHHDDIDRFEAAYRIRRPWLLREQGDAGQTR